MCVVSMVGDFYTEKWKPYTQPIQLPQQQTWIFTPPVSREEFDRLLKEVEDMKALLIRAKKYDEDNNESECEMEDKVKLLKLIAKEMGVDLSEVFGNE